MNEYDVTSNAHLARVRELLANKTNQSLLYAALELRYGIEARLHEYLESANELNTNKNKIWQIKHLSKKDWQGETKREDSRLKDNGRYRDCSCQGKNKDCGRCGGTGYLPND